jgi:MAF protein
LDEITRGSLSMLQLPADITGLSMINISISRFSGDDPVLVLASNSPRRKELLELSGWKFEVIPAEIDERPHPGEPPGSYVLRMAENKVRAVAKVINRDRMIIAADTAVFDADAILGKPSDASDARAMLMRLRGKVHQVYTAIAVLKSGNGDIASDLCITDVPMRPYTDDEMERYIDTGDPMDKAGAYAIQHPDFAPVFNLQGCYANVVGLPLCHLTRTLKKFHLSPTTDIPHQCQESLNYTCPVYPRILSGENGQEDPIHFYEVT